MIRHLTLHVAPHKIYKTFPTKHLNTLNYAKEAKAPAPYRKQKPQMVVNVRCVCCLQCQKNNLRTTTDKVESRDLNFLLSSSSTFGSGSGNLRQCAPFIFIFASFTSKSPELRLPRLVCYASRVCVCVLVLPGRLVHRRLLHSNYRLSKNNFLQMAWRWSSDNEQT